MLLFLFKEALQAYVWERYGLIEKIALSQLAIIWPISAILRYRLDML